MDPNPDPVLLSTINCMKLRLILVGRSEKGYVADGVEHYLTRIGRKEQIEVIVLPEAGKGDPSYQQKVEANRILAALKAGEKLVVLDERGTQFTSPAFANRLSTWRDQGVRATAFVIGGAYGFTDEIRSRADLVLSLSQMTFPHQLVRVLFAEQLYRAYAIIQGSPYHH
jgi:23S rRNA (pseudouridine1915-N3)-methyltransferase